MLVEKKACINYDRLFILLNTLPVSLKTINSFSKKFLKN